MTFIPEHFLFYGHFTKSYEPYECDYKELLLLILFILPYNHL
jgi:hypothetical protein